MLLQQAGSKENFARMLLEQKKKSASRRASEGAAAEDMAKGRDEASLVRTMQPAKAADGRVALTRQSEDQPLHQSWRTTVGYLALLSAVSVAVLCVGQRVLERSKLQ
mmetsp:Transcript_28938/g.58250  ORF Transcript_28938/g.58250 Transcript_28938/m.58250 type:complete len:107 (+) Transcript_28938:1010-1330(+)